MSEVASDNPKLVLVRNFERRLQKMRTASEAWPLIMAKDVLELADSWDVLHQLGFPANFNAFLRCSTGASWTLARFKTAQKIVDTFGEASRRTWTWAAAQWVYNTVPAAQLHHVLDAYHTKWYPENLNNPLSIGMVQTRVRAMLQRKVVQYEPLPGRV